MAELAEFLHKWQDLSGATIGAAFSVLVALIVAYIPMRREDLTAAMLVVSNLVTARSRHTALLALAKERSIPSEEYPLWLSEKLLQSRPKLTPTFDAASMRIMAIDAHLAAHMTHFDLTMREMNEKLDRLDEDFTAKRTTGTTIRTVEHMKSDARILALEFGRLAENAECAERLITLLVLSRSRIWNRARRWLWLTKEEKECLRRLG